MIYCFGAARAVRDSHHLGHDTHTHRHLKLHQIGRCVNNACTLGHPFSFSCSALQLEKIKIFLTQSQTTFLLWKYSPSSLWLWTFQPDSNQMAVTCCYFNRVQLIRTSVDSSESPRSKVFWVRFDPVKRSAANRPESADSPKDGASCRCSTRNLRPNGYSDRRGPKSEIVELIKIYRLASS